MRWTQIAVVCAFVPLTIFSATRMASSASVEEELQQVVAKPSPPPETEQLAPLLGNWRCTTRALQQDGGYVEGTASWKFYTILDGFAIMDEWRAPKPDGTESVGVNIRHYDTETEQWVAKWLSTANMKWATFQATYQEGEFRMTGKSISPSGNAGHSRVTFFDMKKNSFKWKLDWSTDGGKTWIPDVFLIEGERIE
ncbi:MAG: hypothetical protein K0U98_00310 [Deltaproteobacteria bacterium]|nr:hypothetical protein [Deltaproteobacteria bacterium]